MRRVAQTCLIVAAVAQLAGSAVSFIVASVSLLIAIRLEKP